MDKREHVIEEIILTEKNYVTKLETILEVIIRPLQNMKILDPDDIKGQFGFWEALCFLHQELYRRMITEQESNQLEIGKLFIDFSCFLKMYTQYLANFDIARARRGYLLTSNRKFADHLDKMKTDPRFHGMNIEAYLIEPVQRIPRYRLLLESLLKYTPEDHPEYEVIVKALQSVSEVASRNNEAIRERENKDKMMEVMMTFEPRSRVNLFDDPKRNFLKEGNLQKQCRRGVKEFRYWLFSDKIIYGEATGLGSYRVNRQILLNEMRITKSGASNHFTIESKAKSFVIFAKDSTEMNEWYNAIIEAMVAKQSVIDTEIAPVWTPNRDQNRCEICETPFTLLIRRHHCRNCGLLVCDPCSSYRSMVPHVDPIRPVRVCKNCFGELLPKQESPPPITSQKSFGFVRRTTSNTISLLHLPPNSTSKNIDNQSVTVKRNTSSYSDDTVTSTTGENSPSTTINPVQLISNSHSSLESNHSNGRERTQSMSRRSALVTSQTGSDLLYHINREASMSLESTLEGDISDSDLDSDRDDREEIYEREQEDGSPSPSPIPMSEGKDGSTLPSPPVKPPRRRSSVEPRESMPGSPPPPVPSSSSSSSSLKIMDTSVPVDNKWVETVEIPTEEAMLTGIRRSSLEAIASVVSVVRETARRVSIPLSPTLPQRRGSVNNEQQQQRQQLEPNIAPEPVVLQNPLFQKFKSHLVTSETTDPGLNGTDTVYNIDKVSIKDSDSQQQGEMEVEDLSITNNNNSNNNNTSSSKSTSSNIPSKPYKSLVRHRRSLQSVNVPSDTNSNSISNDISSNSNTVVGNTNLKRESTSSTTVVPSNEWQSDFDDSGTGTEN